MPWEIIFIPAVTALLLGFLNGLKSVEEEIEKIELEKKTTRTNRKMK